MALIIPKVTDDVLMAGKVEFIQSVSKQMHRRFGLSNITIDDIVD